MDPVRLGSTGLHASRVCPGMMSCGNDSERPWVLDEAATEPIVRRAVEGIPPCLDQGVGVIPWGPLARGFVAGTRTRSGERRTTRAETDKFTDSLYGRPEDFDVADRVAKVAAERGVPAEQLALPWLLHRAGVTAPSVGATKVERLEDALAAAELDMGAESMLRLGEPYVPHPVLGHG